MKSIVEGGSWQTAVLLGTTKEHLDDIVGACLQRYLVDHRCDYVVDTATTYTVYGAYTIGSQTDLLDYVPLLNSGTGPPATGGPGEPTPYDIQFAWVGIYVDEIIGVVGHNPASVKAWRTITQACLIMVAELTPEQPPATRSEPAENQDPALLFAQKVLIHAILMWQSFESLPIDLLTPLGLSAIYNDPSYVPTFVYWIKWYFDELSPYVGSEDNTWGGIKALYGGEDAE